MNFQRRCKDMLLDSQQSHHTYQCWPIRLCLAHRERTSTVHWCYSRKNATRRSLVTTEPAHDFVQYFASIILIIAPKTLSPVSVLLRAPHTQQSCTCRRTPVDLMLVNHATSETATSRFYRKGLLHLQHLIHRAPIIRQKGFTPALAGALTSRSLDRHIRMSCDVT